jgi:hypothetical protein
MRSPSHNLTGRSATNSVADQDLQKTVDIDVVESIVEDAEHEQADDGIIDTAAARRTGWRGQRRRLVVFPSAISAILQ